MLCKTIQQTIFLTVLSYIWLLLAIMSRFDEIFMIAQQWYKEQLITILGGDLDHQSDSPSRKPG